MRDPDVTTHGTSPCQLGVSETPSERRSAPIHRRSSLVHSVNQYATSDTDDYPTSTRDLAQTPPLAVTNTLSRLSC